MKQYLRKLQLVELDILKEIERICKKYGIKYFLANGSLIGAIRHQGFIPWDDDADIAMTRENYNKFIKVCKTELKDGYFLDCYETNKKCIYPYAKVKRNGTLFVENKNSETYTDKDAIWVDIFPLDNCNYPMSKEHQKQYKIYSYITTLITIKNGSNYYQNSKVKKAIYKAILTFVPFKFMVWLYKKTVTKYNHKDTKYLTSFATVYGIDIETFEKRKITDYKYLKFEDSKFFGLKNYDYYLRKIYGDYMKLPPKEKRANHSPYLIKFEDGEELHFNKEN